MTQVQAIKIDRNNISEANNINFQLPDAEGLLAGTVLLKLDLFSLTTNNITYAVTGNSLKYWDFFPVDAGHSMLPVWGFGEVVASNHSEVKIGERFYGYYPMASHILVHPDKVNAFGFSDANPSRKSNNPVYDHYLNVSADESFQLENEAMHSLYRPLFITSFLTNDFLEENNSFGAEQILITSASSKTGYGLASILHEQNKILEGKTDIVAMTSNSNVEFVKGLGTYDSIITYDNWKELDTSKPTCIIDFTGNQKLLKQIAAHLGDAHVYTSLIGAVQNDKLDDIEGAIKHGQFFFAPIQAQKCIARWGHAEFNRKYSKALNDFIRQTATWLEVKKIDGEDNIKNAYLSLLTQSPSPKEGLVASF
jgi:hypothetical protein